MGAAIVAAMLGSAFFIATASVDWVEYVFIGMAVAYAGVVSRASPALVSPGVYIPPRPATLRKA